MFPNNSCQDCPEDDDLNIPAPESQGGDSEQCAFVVDPKCINYSGNNYSCEGTPVLIQGEDLNTILERMANQLCNGVSGIAATVDVGSITVNQIPNGSASSGTVSNSGTINDAILNFVLNIPEAEPAKEVITKADSTSSVQIGLGVRTFNFPSALDGPYLWQFGTRLRAYHDANNYVEGEVTGHGTTSVAIDVDYVQGTGSHDSWLIHVTGDPGPQGEPADVVDSVDTDIFNTYDSFIGSDLAIWRNLITPVGLISAFALNDNNINSDGYGIDYTAGANLLGWAVCDGRTYQRSDGSGYITAPDLTGRFIVGKDPNAAAGDLFEFGTTGGATNHDHKGIALDDLNIPQHVHVAGNLDAGSHTHSIPSDTTGISVTITNDYQNFNRDSGASERIYGSGAKFNDGSIPNGITVSDPGHDHGGSTGPANNGAITGQTGPNESNGDPFDTTKATNDNGDDDSLPPYYTVIYLMKI